VGKHLAVATARHAQATNPASRATRGIVMPAREVLVGVSWESLLPGLGSEVRVGSWGMGWGSVPVWGSGLVVSPALLR